jgi:SOS-response transcriptional repressor LexA
MYVYNDTMTRTGERLLAFIREYQDTHGKPPTVREMAAGVGVSSTSTIDRWIKIYLESGQLVRIGEPGTACNVRVPDKVTPGSPAESGERPD